MCVREGGRPGHEMSTTKQAAGKKLCTSRINNDGKKDHNRKHASTSGFMDNLFLCSRGTRGRMLLPPIDGGEFSASGQVRKTQTRTDTEK